MGAQQTQMTEWSSADAQIDSITPSGCLPASHFSICLLNSRVQWHGKEMD